MKKLFVIIGILIISISVYLFFFNHFIPQEIVGEYHLVDGNIDMTKLNNAQISLNISQKGEVSGVSAVNQYGGSVEVKTNTIVFSDIFHTEMASMNPNLNEIELEYYDLITRINGYSINDNQLILLENTNPLLFFEKD